MATNPTIELWRWRLDPPPSDLDALRATMSPDEQARADRFVFPIHRRRFVAARGRLRAILGECTGLDPAALRFAYNDDGKPALAGIGEALHFNLSHSGEMAILGITTFGPLGIDIEVVRPVSEDLATHFFAPAEVAALRSLPDDQQLEAFFQCWTRKEAYIKAIGRGLAIPLDSFAVSLRPGEPARLLSVAEQPGEPANWRFAHLLPAPGHIGAIAMRHPAWTTAGWRGDDQCDVPTTSGALGEKLSIR